MTNIHPDEYILHKDISEMAKNIASPHMEQIALRYLNMNNADILHCKVDADRKQTNFSYYLSFYLLEMWCERNKGPRVHRKLFEKLEEARKYEGIIPITAYYPVLQVWVCYSCFCLKNKCNH